jgi:hypothetical protein
VDEGMTRKLMRFGLAAVFLSSGVWLLGIGLGLLTHAPRWWTDWAWNNNVARIFVRVGPLFSIVTTLGSVLGNSLGSFTEIDAACYIAGSIFYLVVGLVLLSGYRKSGTFVAVVCWINAMSLVYRILLYLSEPLVRSWLLWDVAMVLVFLYLGFRAYAGAFTPERQSENTAAQTPSRPCFRNQELRLRSTRPAHLL